MAIKYGRKTTRTPARRTRIAFKVRTTTRRRINRNEK